MRGAWFVGSVRGIPIQIHWSFCLILLWSAYMGYEMGGWGYVGLALLLTVLLFGCVLLHELGHALTAMKFGISTRSITLLPIGGVASLNRIPERPLEEFLITAAGPMVNVVIAGLLYAWLGWPADEMESQQMWDPAYIGYMLLYTNIIMIAFNMIPAFPMDGGRIFRALLAVWLPYQRATMIASSLGQVMALCMVVAGLIHNPVLCLIGVMVYAGARAENYWVGIRTRLEGIYVRDLMDRNPACLDHGAPLSSCANEIYQSGRQDFIIMNGSIIAGVLPRERWLEKMQEPDGSTTVGEVMIKPQLLLSADMPAAAMLRLMTSSRQTIYPVISDGRLAGMVTKSMVGKIHEQGLKAEAQAKLELKEAGRSFIDVG